MEEFGTNTAMEDMYIMRQIRNSGNAPPPIRRMGIFSSKMLPVWMKYGRLEVWECSDVDELAGAAHLDDCEFQILIDKANSRYYLAAMSVDPDRIRGTLDTTEDGAPIMREDTSIKPGTVVYYTEVSAGQYKVWIAADRKYRDDALRRAEDAMVDDVEG